MSLPAYALIGAAATAVHYSCLAALVEGAGIEPGPAAFCGAVIGAVVAYAGNRRWTFGGTRVPHRTAAWRFAMVALAGALLNGLIVDLGHSVLAVHYLAAQVFATVSVMVLSYHLNRWWTFS